MKHISFAVGLCVISSFFFSFSLAREIVQVRIFSHLKVNSLTLEIYTGAYRLYADGNFNDSYRPGKPVTLSVKSDSVVVRQDSKTLGTFRYVKFYGNDGAEMKLKINDPDRKIRSYQDNLSFSIVEGGIRIINEIDLDNYIAGVTEAEAGSRSAQEFYKVQSILARTFALAHLNKHSAEGFSLCDQVHCQAYFGRPKNMAIFRAIEETRNKVVVDENLNLIVAAFHSNSGGQTANSEDVWGARTPYLRSVVDTFSVRMPNSRWHRKMLTDDWLSYLRLKHNFPVDDSGARELALNFKQDSRKNFLEFDAARVPLKNVRMDLQLKSTYFNITPIDKDTVLFSGFGYGHGLGMPQEGAMSMVKHGYSYVDVLNFYFQEIQLIDLQKLNFFKDE